MCENFLSIPINEVWESEIVVNKSRFLGFAKNIQTEDDALAFIDEKHKQFKDARHICFAYCVGNIMRFSDDGEPSGTAGKPMLDVIVKQNVSNVVLVVVRYFGGIKLGAGPLLRTYSNSAKQTLSGQFSIWERAKKIKMICSFKEYQQVLSMFERNKIKVVETDFSDTVKLCVVVQKNFEFGFGKILEQEEIFYSF